MKLNTIILIKNSDKQNPKKGETVLFCITRTREYLILFCNWRKFHALSAGSPNISLRHSVRARKGIILGMITYPRVHRPDILFNIWYHLKAQLKLGSITCGICFSLEV